MMTTRDVVVGSDTDVEGDVSSQEAVGSYYDGGDDDVDGFPCVIVYLA